MIYLRIFAFARMNVLFLSFELVFSLSLFILRDIDKNVLMHELCADRDARPGQSVGRSFVLFSFHSINQSLRRFLFDDIRRFVPILSSSNRMIVGSVVVVVIAFRSMSFSSHRYSI